MRSLCLFLAVLLATAASAQESSRDAELEINDSLYHSIETANMLYGVERGAAAPGQFSMRTHCPVAPVVVSGGMAWSAAISKAMSIQWGYEMRWTPEQIEGSSFSPYFLYDMLPKVSANDCRLHKDWIKQTQEILTTTGNVRLAEYKQKGADCNRAPSRELIRRMTRFRLRGMTKLFVYDQPDGEASVGQKQFVMKRSLGRKHPVVMCIMGDKTFEKLKADQWIPGPGGNELRAVVVIGYDDGRQAFEVAHPAGKTWGRGGFAWIAYKDLVHARYAFELTMEDRPIPPDKPESAGNVRKAAGPDAPENTGLQGALTLNTVDLNGNYVPVMLTSNPEGYYEPQKRYGLHSQFQMIGSGTANAYLYVFGVDPDGEVQLHYPYHKVHHAGLPDVSSAMIAEKQSQMVIPEPVLTYDLNGNQLRKEQVFIKEKVGTDWLVAIYSNQKLDREIQVLIGGLNGHNDDFLLRFQHIFGKYLAPKSRVSFENGRMKFTTGVLPKGAVVPVILKIDSSQH